MYKSLVSGDEFLVQGLHLKSHQRCSAVIRTWLSADQSSSFKVTLNGVKYYLLSVTVTSIGNRPSAKCVNMSYEVREIRGLIVARILL